MKKHFILFFLCSFQFIFAETVELDLNSAIKLAYNNNSHIKRQKLTLDAAKKSAGNSYNSLIPSISVSASDNYVFPDEEPSNTVNLEGNVSLNFKTSIKSSADKARLNFELEKVNFALQKNEVRQTVCDSYFEILEAQQQLSFKNENLKILRELYEENQNKFKKGFLSEIEYLNSKILFEKSASEQLALQLELKNLTNNYKLVLGLPVSDEILMKSDLSELFNTYSTNFTEQFKTELTEALSKNDFPELKALDFQKLLLEKELKIKKHEAFGPDFNFSYQVNPLINQSDSEKKIKNTFNAGVSIPLHNLIPASKAREEIFLVQTQIKDMEIQISSKKQELENTLVNLLLLVNQKMETLETCKTLVKITKSNLEITTASYSKGMVDFQSLKNSNKDYLEAQIEYSTMVLEILKTFSSLEQICGKSICEEC